MTATHVLPGAPGYLMCAGGCGNQLVDSTALQKGGRRRYARNDRCRECADRYDAASRPPPPPAPPVPAMTEAQRAVLTLLENEIADDAERRMLAAALGLQGETP